MARVIRFELPSRNMGDTVEFYNKVFDWDSAYSDVHTDYLELDMGRSTIAGGIFPRGVVNLTTTTLVIEVASIEAYVGRIEGAGGTIVLRPRAIAGYGYVAYCRDPDGNVIGLVQFDESVTDGE